MMGEKKVLLSLLLVLLSLSATVVNSQEECSGCDECLKDDSVEVSYTNSIICIPACDKSANWNPGGDETGETAASVRALTIGYTPCFEDGELNPKSARLTLGDGSSPLLSNKDLLSVSRSMEVGPQGMVRLFSSSELLFTSDTNRLLLLEGGQLTADNGIDVATPAVLGGDSLIPLQLTVNARGLISVKDSLSLTNVRSSVVEGGEISLEGGAGRTLTLDATTIEVSGNLTFLSGNLEMDVSSSIEILSGGRLVVEEGVTLTHTVGERTEGSIVVVGEALVGSGSGDVVFDTNFTPFYPSSRFLVVKDGGILQLNGEVVFSVAGMEIQGGALSWTEDTVLTIADSGLNITGSGSLTGSGTISDGTSYVSGARFQLDGLETRVIAGDPWHDVAGNLDVQVDVELLGQGARAAVFIDKEGTVSNLTLSRVTGAEKLVVDVIASEEWRAFHGKAFRWTGVVEVEDGGVSEFSLELAANNATRPRAVCTDVSSSGSGLILSIECEYQHPFFDALGFGGTMAAIAGGLMILTALIMSYGRIRRARMEKKEGEVVARVRKNSSGAGKSGRKAASGASIAPPPPTTPQPEPPKGHSAKRKVSVGRGKKSGRSRSGSKASKLSGDGMRSLEKMLVKSPSFIDALCDSAGTGDLKKLASALVSFWLSKHKALDIFRGLCERHVASATDDGELFRSSSVAAALIQALFATLAPEFLPALLGPAVDEIILSSVIQKTAARKSQARPDWSSSFESIARELDPNKAEDAAVLEENKRILIVNAERLADLITENDPPVEIHAVLHTIYKAVRSKFPESVADRVVATAYLVRYVTPGIALPNSHGVTSQAVGPNTQRNLLLISKMINGLASEVVFGDKEEFLKAVEDFRAAFSGDMKEHLSGLGKRGPSASAAGYASSGRYGSMAAPEALDVIFPIAVSCSGEITSALKRLDDNDALGKWRAILESRGRKRSISGSGRKRKNSASSGRKGSKGSPNRKRKGSPPTKGSPPRKPQGNGGNGNGGSSPDRSRFQIVSVASGATAGSVAAGSHDAYAMYAKLENDYASPVKPAGNTNTATNSGANNRLSMTSMSSLRSNTSTGSGRSGGSTAAVAGGRRRSGSGNSKTKRKKSVKSSSGRH